MIIGKPVAGDASIRQEDEFQPSLGGVRVGDSITIDYGNGYVKDYRVKGIYFTGWSQADSAVYVTSTDMALVDPKALDNADYITVKAKPGYSETFIKNELIQYGVTPKVQTTADLLSKSMGRALQSFAIINMVSLIVSIIITTVVLFIVITIKTINSRRQIGILKAIGVDKEVIMHNYGFQVIILGILGIILGIILTLAARGLHGSPPHRDSRMVCHPVPDAPGPSHQLPDPVLCGRRCRVCPCLPGLPRGYPDCHEGLI